jgi:segregation and condensation protein B
MTVQEAGESIDTDAAGGEGEANGDAASGEDVLTDEARVAAIGDDHVRRLERIIESVLFASGTPLGLRKLVEILAASGSRPAAKDVLAALAGLRRRYAPGRGGIQLYEVAGGYQLRTARENAEWVRAVFRDKPARLGRATLETLAIIAYKQPVTRADIEAIRGVDVDGVLATLLARRLIKIAGRKEAVGRPLLYATTPEFLEAFGLKDLNDLPSLKELVPVPETDRTESSASDEPAPASAPAPETADGCSGAAGSDPAAAGPAPATPGALAEDPQPGGDRLAAEGGGADPGGARTAERPAGDGAGDAGESTG